MCSEQTLHVSPYACEILLLKIVTENITTTMTLLQLTPAEFHFRANTFHISINAHHIISKVTWMVHPPTISLSYATAIPNMNYFLSPELGSLQKQ